MTNKNKTVLYTGVTNDLVKRVSEHKQKLINGFTKKYNAVNLVYFEYIEDPLVAIAREKSIKNLVRRKKERLINEKNPEWIDLYDQILSG